MRHLVSVTLTCVLLLLPLGAGVGLTGCASSGQVAEGQEAFVVEAEKDLRTAFHVVDGFLAWEAANRAAVGAEVTALADDLRVRFPVYLQSAEDVLRTYKRTRDADGRASVRTWLTTVNSAMLAALRHLPPPQANAAYAAAGPSPR
jgi:hypothetical protein